MKIDNFIEKLINISLDTDIRYILYFNENDYRSPYLQLDIKFENKFVDGYGLYQYEQIDNSDYTEYLLKICKEVEDIDLKCVDKNYQFTMPLYQNKEFWIIKIEKGRIKVK